MAGRIWRTFLLCLLVLAAAGSGHAKGRPGAFPVADHFDISACQARARLLLASLAPLTSSLRLCVICPHHVFFFPSFYIISVSIHILSVYVVSRFRHFSCTVSLSVCHLFSFTLYLSLNLIRFVARFSIFFGSFCCFAFLRLILSCFFFLPAASTPRPATLSSTYGAPCAYVLSLYLIFCLCHLVGGPMCPMLTHYILPNMPFRVLLLCLIPSLFSFFLSFLFPSSPSPTLFSFFNLFFGPVLPFSLFSLPTTALDLSSHQIRTFETVHFDSADLRMKHEHTRSRRSDDDVLRLSFTAFSR